MVQVKVLYVLFLESYSLKIEGNDLIFLNAHRWMQVSGASEVPQSRGKLFFSGSPAAVFLLKNWPRSISLSTKYKQ